MKVATDEAVVSTQDEPYSVRLASKYASAAVTRPSEERRQYSRHRERDLDWVRAVRLRSGHQVSLVDLSAGGALLEADVPLRPGSVLSLEIMGGGIEAVVSFQVLRCHVAALMADSARYRGACEFARPIELPGVHPDLPVASVDAFVGLDFALKRLVERAYTPDTARRLASGDVMLVLQTLMRRALSVEADPIGRQMGNILQELLPALRHRRGLPTMLAAIERQLCHVLPDVRVRLTDAGTAPAGVKSVLITLPSTAPASHTVSIDLPPDTIVNDAQARLLRTSSRLIALVQRLDSNHTVKAEHTDGVAGVPPIQRDAQNPSATIESDPPALAAAWQKVVVRYSDGQTLKGFTHDFTASRSQFSLWPSVTAASHERIVVPLARLKAVFFVREFGGDPDYVEQKTFERPPQGRRIEVTLLDHEVLVGTTLNYRPDAAGFFISPADPRANNLRVFVVSSAVRQVRFP